MDRFFLFVVSFATILILGNLLLKTTGFALTAGADVSIKEKMEGRVTLDFKSAINIGEMQSITAEFTNTGTVTVTSRIEVTVYFYNQTRLEPIAFYYDSYAQLAPGMKKSFNADFSPPYFGTYYIKARVPYDTKVTEVWGVFSIIVNVTLPPPIIIYVPPETQGPWTYQTVEAGIPRLSSEYQKKYDLYPGQSQLININTKNIGQVTLYDLKLSTSTTSLIKTDVNPKVISVLRVNASNIFLISLEIPLDMSSGTYPLEFEIISDKITDTGTITLNITSVEVSIKDDVYQIILNYDYLITELENKISDAKTEGVDVTDAEISFERAKLGLQAAKDLYNSGDYEGARSRLDTIKKDFEDVVFRLAHAQLKLYVAPAFSPFLILVVIILLGIIFLFYSRRKRKEKRPKLLTEAVEET
jgi:hypothetical protein